MLIRSIINWVNDHLGDEGRFDVMGSFKSGCMRDADWEWVHGNFIIIYHYYIEIHSFILNLLLFDILYAV